nr:hypothetical protein [Streptococcus equi]
MTRFVCYQEFTVVPCQDSTGYGQEKAAYYLAQGPFNQALGLWYAGEKFSPEAKADVEHKVAKMIEVYKSRLETADWLAPATREKAITKLNVITPHIGYPENYQNLC